MRQYLYTEHLAEVTPWTPSAIRTMITRGVFKDGVHYFKPRGRNGRPIFKWAAVVELIEEGEARESAGDTIPLASGRVIDLNEAAAEIRGLRD